MTTVALYARVSSEMQLEGFSIEAQLREMREYAVHMGMSVYREYVDRGYSARTANRPQFQMLLHDVQLRSFDVLLVHKLDRLYRNLKQLLSFFEQLEHNDIKLYSVKEQLDFNSPAGKMFLSQLGMLAEFYSNILREETIKGKYQRVVEGLWNGDIPYGYCRGLCDRCDDPNGKGYCPRYGGPALGEGKYLVAHPKDSIGLIKAFFYHVFGRLSDRAVAQALNAEGYRSNTKRQATDAHRVGGPKPFSNETIRDMLQNPFYLGFTKYKGQLHLGKQPALILPPLFELSQQVRQSAIRVPRSVRTHTSHSLLSGILFCDVCGFSMRLTRNNYGLRYYRDGAERHGATCPRRRPVPAEVVENQVRAALTSRPLPPVWQQRAARLAGLDPQSQAEDTERRLLASKLDRLKNMYLSGDIADAEYEQQRKRTGLQLQRLLNQGAKLGDEVLSWLENLDRLWNAATMEERKRWVRAVVKRVTIMLDDEARIECWDTFNPALAAKAGSSSRLLRGKADGQAARPPRRQRRSSTVR